MTNFSVSSPSNCQSIQDIIDMENVRIEGPGEVSHTLVCISEKYQLGDEYCFSRIDQIGGFDENDPLFRYTEEVKYDYTDSNQRSETLRVLKKDGQAFAVVHCAGRGPTDVFYVMVLDKSILMQAMLDLTTAYDGFNKLDLYDVDQTVKIDQYLDGPKFDGSARKP